MVPRLRESRYSFITICTSWNPSGMSSHFLFLTADWASLAAAAEGGTLDVHTADICGTVALLRTAMYLCIDN